MSCYARAVCAVAALSWTSAAAATFPARTVQIVVPYPISGPSDIRGTSRLTKTYKLIAENAPPAISDTLARIVADAIRTDSPHPVSLQRQPGGATTRGAARVAQARPDGHTLLLASNVTIVIGPQYFYGVPYRPVRDFSLVSPLVTMPFVLMVNATLPVEGVQRLIAWLKVRPGEINYGSSGDGSTGHLGGELFRRLAGLDVVHVSYNGGLAALNALATHQVSYMFAALPLALPYLTSQYVRPLAVTTARRVAFLPELPTVAESGLPAFDVEGWYAIFAPARTPGRAAAWLRERIADAVADPVVQERLRALGLEPANVSLEKFATRINSELDEWAPVVRASRLQLEEPSS
jgi:tripartite-type tricarboxylate transporter receptor subunit TctC